MQTLESTLAGSQELPLDYKPCGCAGVLAGRGCTHCFLTRWLKRCKDCLGLGTLEKTARQANSAARIERCGRCAGAGWVSCPLREVQLAKASQEEILEEGSPSSAEEYAQLEVPVHRTRTPKKLPPPVKQRKKPGPKPKHRPQNPLEAMAMKEPGDTPEAAKAAAEAARKMTWEDLKPLETQDVATISTGSPFAPDDLPPAA